MKDVHAETDRLIIRPWKPDECEWYVEHVDDKILRWTNEPEYVDPETWEAARLAQESSDEVRRSAITRRDDGTLLGNIGVRRNAASMEIFYWVGSEHRGHGVATEALVALSLATEEDYGLPLELRIGPNNFVSRNVAEKAGYRFAGYRDSCENCADEKGRVAVYRRLAPPPSTI